MGVEVGAALVEVSFRGVGVAGGCAGSNLAWHANGPCGQSLPNLVNRRRIRSSDGVVVRHAQGLVDLDANVSADCAYHRRSPGFHQTSRFATSQPTEKEGSSWQVKDRLEIPPNSHVWRNQFSENICRKLRRVFPQPIGVAQNISGNLVHYT